MPIIPTVFYPIRSNDVQTRAFKAYKNFRITDINFSTSSGYFRHDALFKQHPPHVDDNTFSYPVNLDDNTNKHVLWNVIDHRYYRWFDPARCFDFKSIDTQTRFLWHSASILTCPYGQVGEQIKPGSGTCYSTIGSTTITLADDGNGNLRDNLISSSSFASSSNNFFYLSFNKLYQQFETIDNIGQYSGEVFYKLSKVDKLAKLNSTISIQKGVVTTGDYNVQSGLCCYIQSGSYIRIPNNEKFDRFNSCDEWTISFWKRRNTSTSISSVDLLSKYGVREITYWDKISKQHKKADKTYTRVSGTSYKSYNKNKTPFIISANNSDSLTETIHFQSSNGTTALHISSSQFSCDIDTWHHYAIRNSGSLCQIFIDGVSSGTSGSLPAGILTNISDIIIGSSNGTNYNSNIDFGFAEFRMYDYAVNQTGIDSLSNRHYLSGSLFQTNIAGNIFYKNGQFVVSSPFPKYNSGSGFFGNTFNASYKGTHTIYENEVLVRVPSDQFNVTMNPSSTYQLSTTKKTCSVNQTELLPGEFRKNLFVSGTLNPYITTIGLYNENAQLLAVGKLAQPIQKRNDVDMSFVIRWDV